MYGQTGSGKTYTMFGDNEIEVEENDNRFLPNNSNIDYLQNLKKL